MKTSIVIAIAAVFSVLVSVSACKKDSDKAPEITEATTDSSYLMPLSKGINLSNWFNDYSDPAQYANRFTDAHFALLKQLGFTYVRIPVGQNILFQPGDPSTLKPYNVQYVENAVQKAIANGLAVTLNYHTASDGFEMTLPTNTENQDNLAAYWKAVAKYFKKFSNTEIFFEVYNEPHVASNGSMSGITKLWWTPVQKKLIDAIRTETTDHYIIAGGEGWNSIEGLKLLAPYKAHNVIYNFHFYEPFFFTHQGATWAGPVQKLRDVPYPSSPEIVQPLIDTATDSEVIQFLTWYGNDEWNASKIEGIIKQARDWAVAHEAAIICNEFGSYKEFAPRQARLDVIRDIRTSLEKFNIGWAMWEMDEGFGFIDYTGNDRTSFTTDDEVLASLGLK